MNCWDEEVVKEDEKENTEVQKERSCIVIEGRRCESCIVTITYLFGILNRIRHFSTASPLQIK